MLIILDRDGVINYDSEHFIKSPDEWVPIPGSLKAIANFKKEGHRVVVATNQSGLGRGLYDEKTLEAIHQKMKNALAKEGGELDGIFYCPHHPDDGCDCRKPKPGLLLQIAKAFDADLSDAVFIGDSERDVEAAHAAGCRAILVRTGNGERALDNGFSHADVPVFDDLLSVRF